MCTEDLGLGIDMGVSFMIDDSMGSMWLFMGMENGFIISWMGVSGYMTVLNRSWSLVGLLVNGGRR